MFWALCGAAGEGWRRDAQVSVHTCPLQSEAGHGRAPPDLGPCSGRGGAALGWSSLPGSPAHSSISDLTGALGRSLDAESRRPPGAERGPSDPRPFHGAQGWGGAGTAPALHV